MNASLSGSSVDICLALQNSDLTKQDLSFYISKGSTDALILLYIGLTTPICDFKIRHYWDEETNDIVFVTRRQTVSERCIYEADAGEVEEVTKRVKELIETKEGGEKYRKILVAETEDLEILWHYASQGDEEAKDKIGLIEWRNSLK